MDIRKGLTMAEKGYAVPQKQSYLVKMEQKKKDMIAAGQISCRFPDVAKIIFHITYYEKTSDPALMVRTVNFIPSDYACFHLDCTREECKSGGFDFAPVVADLVRNRKKSVKGKIFCHGKSETLRFGHSSVDYKIDVEYCKARKIAKTRSS